MKITCYIVDDESDAIAIMKDYIQRTPGLELVGTSLDPLEALDELTCAHAPDLTFIDVDMRQLSGLELAGMVNLYTSVVFTTAFPQYALQAFDKEAFDFLLKPITYERFLVTIQRVKKRLHKQKSHFLFKQDDFFNIKSEIKGRMFKIRFGDVLYIEGAVNYITIHTLEEKHMTYLTIRDMEQALPGSCFVRVHRSFIVNLNFVKVIERARIILENGISLALGDHYKQKFLELMDARLVKTNR